MPAADLDIVIVPELPRDAAVVNRNTVFIPDHGSAAANERAAHAAFDASLSLEICPDLNQKVARNYR